MEEPESGFDFLFDFQVTPNGKIDKSGGNVARMNTVIDNGPRFRRSEAGRRLIHGGNGAAGIWIAAFEVPHHPHNGEGPDRQENDGVAAQKPYQFRDRAWLLENAFGNKDVDCHAPAHGQGIIALEE